MSSDLLARIAAKRQEYTGAPDTTPTAALPGAPSQEEKVVSASGRPAETDADSSSSSSSMIDSMIEAKLEYARDLGTTPALADPISERKKVIVVHDPAPTTVDSALLRNAASTMPASNPGSVLARIEAKRLEYLHAPDTTPKPAAGVQVVKEIVMGRAPEPEPDPESVTPPCYSSSSTPARWFCSSVNGAMLT